ncbi:piragua [Haematobia irritans]|uniref:piragua n=1 Tax=Haematobia irritans TaxID=7368 RepID=UPI003F4FB779
MVDLDCIDSTSKTNEEISQQTQDKKLCRLCLLDEDTSEKVFDIFDDSPVDEKGKKIKSLEEVLYELFQIKYDRSCTGLPHVICQRCWDMVQAFSSFRQIVIQSEELLQKRLELMKSHAFQQDLEDKRPGLNGNPGVFVPDDDCEIQEVNPYEEFESSDDDFSMESESEPEDEKLPIKEKESQSLASTPVAVSSTIAQKTPISDDVQHSKDVSAVLGEPKVLEFTKKNTYLCQYCDMAFTTHPECLEHETTKHDNKMPYVCIFCQRRYSNRQTMIQHIKETHDDKPYICAVCQKGFCRRSDLKKHTIVHTGVRPFACPLCSKSFSRNTNLYKHMRIHSSNKPYVCQQCPRSFNTGSELLRHARTHSEVKPFKCSKCPMAYTRKDKLQIHEQSHIRKENEALQNQARINAQPFSLMQNEDQFENMPVPLNPYINQELQQLNEQQQRLLFSNAAMPVMPAFPQLPPPSMMTSTPPLQPSIVPPAPVKPPPATKSSHCRLHNCDICGKSFTRERDLHRHQALHLDTLFTCKQCGVGFNRREKLARHELEHAPQYPCEICRITFHKKDELDRHLKMHELQQNAALSTQQAILNAAGVGHPPVMDLSTSQMHHAVPAAMNVVPTIPPVSLPPPQRPSAADMSFYSQMVPTMNLGFYSETRPEDRNGI